MGCDIHVNVEYKSKNIPWRNIDFYKKNPYYSKDDIDDSEQEFDKVDCYNRRNYWLFGILAGVRYYDAPTISTIRGLPEDCCLDFKELYKSWGSDAHSVSWYLLSELKEAQSRLKDESLQKFIDSIEQRYIDSEKYGFKIELTEDETQNIRVVFWFDN